MRRLLASLLACLALGVALPAAGPRPHTPAAQAAAQPRPGQAEPAARTVDGSVRRRAAVGPRQAGAVSAGAFESPHWRRNGEEIAAIAGDLAAADFREHDRRHAARRADPRSVMRLFGVMTSNMNSPPSSRPLDREMAPKFAAARDEITHNEASSSASRPSTSRPRRRRSPPEQQRLTALRATTASCARRQARRRRRRRAREHQPGARRAVHGVQPERARRREHVDGARHARPTSRGCRTRWRPPPTAAAESAGKPASGRSPTRARAWSRS